MFQAIKLKKVTKESISELQQICFNAYAQNFADPWNENGLDLYLEKEFGKEWLEMELKSNSIFYYCVLLNQMIVGFLKINYKPTFRISNHNTCELKKIYILPENKGLGIGKAALKGVIEKIRKRGNKMLFLCVIDTNIQAIAFYKKFGFKFHSKTRLNDSYFKEELKGMNRMHLDLNNSK